MIINCIVCALDIEFIHIKKYFDVNAEYRVEKDCEIAECNKGKLIIIKSGIGKLLAGKYTEYAIKKYKDIRHIYSTGIAGAISPDLKIGDIVIGNEVIDYAGSENISKYMLEGDSETEIELLDERGIYRGKILSSDIIINDNSIRNAIYNCYGALCVEMESAGVFHKCVEYKIPFTAIKIISDNADGKAIISMLRAQKRVMDQLGAYIKRKLNRKD